MSQDAFVQQLSKDHPMDRTTLSRIENGERDLPLSFDHAISGMNWKFALKVADERTDGYISYYLDHVPNMDLHPAALKDLFLKEMSEAERVLGELVLAKHIDPEKRRESAERVWQEIRDVLEKGLVMQGVLEEEFGLDRARLIKKHEMEIRKGDR
jgi:hypothetical protein